MTSYRDLSLWAVPSSTRAPRVLLASSNCSSDTKFINLTGAAEWPNSSSPSPPAISLSAPVIRLQLLKSRLCTQPYLRRIPSVNRAALDTDVLWCFQFAEQYIKFAGAWGFRFQSDYKLRLKTEDYNFKILSFFSFLCLQFIFPI